MPDEPIGSVRVDVVADYSKLSQGFQAAQGEAAKAGASIASSFTSAVGPTNTLTAAAERLRNAEAALTSEGAKMLAQVQATSPGFASAQKQLDGLNAELRASKAAYEALAGARTTAASAATAHAAATAHEVSELQATSGFIRTLEGSGGLRAVENFLSKTLGLGPALQAIFPIVGAIAFLEILGRMVEKTVEFFQLAAQAPERVGGEFRQLNASIQATNDELQVENDRLDEQIAKLSGQQPNGLKRMLDEAIVSADKLSASIQKTLSSLAELLKQERVGVLSGAFLGRAPSDRFEETLAGKTGLGGKQAEIDKLTSEGNQKIRAAGTLEEANAARTQTRIALEKLLNGLYDDRVKRLAELKSITADTTPKTGPVALGGGALGAVPGGPTDVSVEAEKAQATATAIQKKLEQVRLDFANVSKTQSASSLQLAKEASDAAKQAAQDQYRIWQDEIAQKKATDAVTLSEETAFWTERLTKATAGGAAYADVVRSIDTKVGTLHQEAIRRSIAEGNRSESETLHEIEQQIKAAQVAAEEAGGRPAAVKLKFLVDLAGPNAPDTGLSADNQKKLASQIPDAQHAANKEATADLRRMLAEQDQAWLESGIRTAGEVKQRAEIARNALEELRPFFVGIDALIDAETAKIIAANKRLEAEKLKVADLVARNQEAGGQTEIASRRIALESAYGLQVVHTYQQQISYQQQLAGLEAESLKLKQGLADEEYRAAVASRDAVRIQEALNAQAAAGAAIELQAQKAEADRKKREHENSFSGQLAAGLNADAEAAVSRLSAGIATLATQTKGWGQEFKNILRDIEKSIIQTFAHAALRQGLNALENLGKQHQQSGAGGVLGAAASGVSGALAKVGIGAVTGGAQAAAQTANTAALTADTAALVTNTAASTAVVAAETGMLAAMTAQAVDVAANTIALAALTAAVIELSTVEAINAILPFAAGGDPPVGVPSLVGERGPELFIPKTAGTIVPADKTKTMLQRMQEGLAGFQVPAAAFDIPNAPASAFFSGAQAHSISSSSASAVNNHNTGNIGTAHFNIYESRNPRQTVREIASYMKLSSPKFSPANS